MTDHEIDVIHELGRHMLGLGYRNELNLMLRGVAECSVDPDEIISWLTVTLPETVRAYFEPCGISTELPSRKRLIAKGKIHCTPEEMKGLE